MKVIMLSTDRTMFERGSPARQRMEEYAAAFGKLSIIVFATQSAGFVPDVGVKLSLYPTNSRSRFSYMHDAVRLAETLMPADVISAQDPFETGRAGKMIAKRHGIPLHVQIHTNFLAPGFAGAHWPLNWARLMFAPGVIRAAASIRTVSSAIKEALEKKYHPRAPISVLPIYADISGVPPAHVKHARFKTALLVVSRLEKEKRVDVAIRALKTARDAGIDAGLDIVGNGREEGRLRHLAKRLGVADFVEFHGFQSQTAPYYASADAILYPGAPYEGFGMAIIEALAAGVPVLANGVGIAREAGATIVHGTGPDDFGAALVAFLKKFTPAAEGPRKSLLLYKPYASKEEYLQKFAADIAVAAQRHN
ncbi:MAG: glycosyltransferase [Patescibacteria group bacterium]|nr:glycosyltransferase [Patescibacteria group bacterium]